MTAAGPQLLQEYSVGGTFCSVFVCVRVVVCVWTVAVSSQAGFFGKGAADVKEERIEGV